MLLEQKGAVLRDVCQRSRRADLISIGDLFTLDKSDFLGMTMPQDLQSCYQAVYMKFQTLKLLFF